VSGSNSFVGVCFSSPHVLRVQGVYDLVDEAAGFVKSKLSTIPSVAVIVEQGLCPEIFDSTSGSDRIAFEDIPHLEVST